MLLTTKEPIILIPVTNEANPGISAEDSESGDEVAPSPAVPNPFINIELGVVQYKYKRLHKAYHTALEANFDNAQGKVFVQELLVFLLPQEVYCCEISTSPHGDKQPGALTVEWVTHKPSPLQSRIKESDAVKTQERCADVIAYNEEKKHHTIVIEVKCNGKDAKPQLLEQMCGLFHPRQKFMLGLQVHPTFITPLMLLKDEKALKLFNVTDIPIREGEGLKELAALILSTSREVSEQ